MVKSSVIKRCNTCGRFLSEDDFKLRNDVRYKGNSRRPECKRCSKLKSTLSYHTTKVLKTNYERHLVDTSKSPYGVGKKIVNNAIKRCNTCGRFLSENEFALFAGGKRRRACCNKCKNRLNNYAYHAKRADYYAEIAEMVKSQRPTLSSEIKRCGRCGKFLSVSEFPENAYSGSKYTSLRSICRKCVNNAEYVKRYVRTGKPFPKNNPNKKVYKYSFKKIPKHLKRKTGLKAKRPFQQVEDRGPEFKKDFLDLETKHFWDLSAMARKHSMTRQRLDQIYRAVHGHGYGVAKKRKKLQREEEAKMARKYPYLMCGRYPVSMTKTSGRKGYNYVIAEAEMLFIEECKARGLKVETNRYYARAGFKVNGKLVYVKSSNSSKMMGDKNQIPHFTFKVKSHQTKECDFIVIYRRDLDSFFIVPKEEIGQSDKDKTLCMLAYESDHHAALNKYWDYEDKWDLLN